MGIKWTEVLTIVVALALFVLVNNWFTARKMPSTASFIDESTLQGYLQRHHPNAL